MKRLSRFGFILILLIIAYLAGSESLFKSSRQISVKEVSCPRKNPYPREPEFERAMSLIRQRVGVLNNEKKGGNSWVNCLNIQYADLNSIVGEEVEGLFYFDENSSIDNLKIYVDNSYKEKDDLLIALLLIHETSHVLDYIEFLETGIKKSCVESEVTAFYMQNGFISYLNNEEQMSLLARINAFQAGHYKTNRRAEQSMSMLFQLKNLMVNAQALCSRKYNIGSDDWHNCAKEKEKQFIEEMVRNNPYYQKQCGL